MHRRHFLSLTAAFTLAPRARASLISESAVAAIERPRILADAALALTHTPSTLLPTAADIAALAAAFHLTKDDRYAAQAGTFLSALFTSLSPTPDLATPATLVDFAPLAELARALPFLADNLPPPTLTLTRTWLRDFLTHINTTHIALIARDAKDHTASTWLLLNAAIARTLGDEAALTATRHRFKAPMLRNQITANGTFPHELATANPFRNTLFNFDLLAATCESLSTPFSTLWDLELEDGPGLRAVAAALFPILRDRNTWPFLADATDYRQVPLRRPALLLTGRAYLRPDYIDLWKQLPPPPPTERLSPTYPIREALLWTTRPPHTT